MALLITGGAGFIGRRLIQTALKERRKIVISHREANPFRSGPSVRFVRCDLRNFKDVQALFRRHAIDAVVHLAGAGITRADKEEIWATNVGGTFHLLQAAAERGVERFIHIGSYWELLGRVTPAKDADGADWRRAYVTSKICQSALVRDFEKERKLPTLILRLFSVYGPGESPGRLFPSIVGAALRGESVDLSPGRRKRDYVFVDDVAGAIERAVAIPRFPRGRTLDIAGGQALSVREIVRVLRRRPYTVEGFDPRFGRRPYDPMDVPSLCGSPEAAGRLLRWKCGVDMAEGLDILSRSLTDEGCVSSRT